MRGSRPSKIEHGFAVCDMVLGLVLSIFLMTHEGVRRAFPLLYFEFATAHKESEELQVANYERAITASHLVPLL